MAFVITRDQTISSREVFMTISMNGAEAHLDGDWTLAGVTRNIDTLAVSLQQLESMNVKQLRVNCGHVEEADIGGLQVLNVWMQCVKIRGMEPILVDVPTRLRHAVHVLTGHHCGTAYP